VCLDDDDDLESLLDLDAEMHEYEVWPATAADLADSLHLAIAEDDDDDYDIDIEHGEYELDDVNDVL